MATDVIMPRLGESITEGTILEWKKNVGDSVSRDETILEISTDKVDSEVPSPASGILLEILYDKNAVVAVGEVIARIGESGEKISSSSKPADIEKTKTAEKGDDNSIVREEPDKETISVATSKERKFYSPLVRSIAKKESITLDELDLISGTGHNGRINKSDILNYIQSKEPSDNKVDNKRTATKYHLEDRIEPMGHVRKMIAQHMIESRDTSVHVYSSSEVDMTQIVDFRNQ